MCGFKMPWRFHNLIYVAHWIKKWLIIMVLLGLCIRSDPRKQPVLFLKHHLRSMYNCLYLKWLISSFKCQVIKFPFLFLYGTIWFFHCVKMSRNSCDLMFGDDWHKEVSERVRMTFSQKWADSISLITCL